MSHLRHLGRLTFALSLFSLITLGASCSSEADGGVFLSSDEGETWEQRVFVREEKRKIITISTLNVENIFFDPQNPDVMYVASKDSGLFQSIDAGESWTQLPVPAERVRDIGINPVDTNILYATINTTIVKSIDGGENWETVYTDPRNATVLRVEPDWVNPSRIFAANSVGNVILSSDGGINWSTVFAADEPISDLVIDPVDSRILYAVELDRNVHKSTDGGNTWQELITDETVWIKPLALREDVEDTEARKPSAFRTLTIDPNNHLNLYMLCPQGISHSSDGGLTWTYVNTLIALEAQENSSIRSFMVMPGSPQTYLFALGRIVHKTTNSGNAWKTIENFPSSRLITVLTASPKAPDRIYAGTEKIEKKGIFSR